MAAENQNTSRDINVDTPALLTAIIFTYNHENTIGKCIESIVNQKTGYQYEIHIWDDCSTDNTSNICRMYADKYPEKIQLVVQKENTFLKPDLELQSFAAIKKIATRYFCIIDGDDYWCDENKIQIALDFLETHPEYIGFAHDTLQVNKSDASGLSYIHDLANCTVSNPVTLSEHAPFFLTSSRIFRKCDYETKQVLPIDYLLYYYHLAKGPIHYHDKIMASYVIGENSTFANLGRKIKNLNSMFPYRLSLLFDFQQDDFCTAMQKKYDNNNSLDDSRYNRLCWFKKIFGVRRGWTLWFILTFVWRYGLECMNINYVYCRKKTKRNSDTRLVRKARCIKKFEKIIAKQRKSEKLVEILLSKNFGTRLNMEIKHMYKRTCNRTRSLEEDLNRIKND